MRIIEFEKIKDAVCAMCGQAACDLPQDVLEALKKAKSQEKSELGQEFFDQYLKNSEIASTERLPLCQDTGFAVFFVRLGSEVMLDKGTVSEAINAGVREGYKKFFLRKSIVADPLFDRKNTFDNTPAVIHLEQVPGDKLHITLAPKGGGSENMSALRMLKPSEGRQGVVDFVVHTVCSAGGNPCPPTIVGVGIGGTMEHAAYLAKKALLRPVGTPSADPRYAELEAEILEKVNASGVGPQGLGGSVTSLSCHIEYFPCHLASLPVAVNLNCHAARHAEVKI
jgi:fumarate hydratase subunit alpha